MRVRCASPKKSCVVTFAATLGNSTRKAIAISISTSFPLRRSSCPARGRESGYDCVDVTKDIVEQVDGVVYAFMAPDNDYPEMKISRRYIQTCLGGIDPAEHDEWLKSSIILNEIEEIS